MNASPILARAANVARVIMVDPTMASESLCALGIDLGTTNSAAAVYDGENVSLVRSSQGGVLTPSVVRLDARANHLVGARARRFMDADPENTRGEFKRLMGTSHTLHFRSAGVDKRPEELSALVLETLRRDFEQQFGFAPREAVITVPALFELPQNRATADAARIAGFERIELLQEPVASAIAAGWTRDDSGGPWLVYDLGGGTFDASLLETKEGLLRVVGHDGDNFLGGRDIDQLMVEWILAELERRDGVRIDVRDAEHATSLRRLRLACEEAKCDAADGDIVLVLPRAFVVGGRDVDVDMLLPRGEFDAICSRVVERTIAVCERLLRHHGLSSSQLGQVVLVGGPTVMPTLRNRVRDALGNISDVRVDPMTVVAEGAALFAGSAGLDARPKAAAPKAEAGPKVWLQFPALTSDPSPYVVGRLVSVEADIAKVKLRHADGGWESSEEPVDAEGCFTVMVQLKARSTTELLLEGVSSDGRKVPLNPKAISIRHGVALSDPPLSRSVGVALADNSVRVYFERGCPLPARRTFSFSTVQTIAPGSADLAIRIPIVQGEFPFANLCRLVGTLEISGLEMKQALLAGSMIEVTLSFDRAGTLHANARVPLLNQVFDSVANLVSPTLSSEQILALVETTRQRIEAMYADAMQFLPDTARLELVRLDDLLEEVAQGAHCGAGGDADALERARRQLLDIDGKLAELEAEKAWPELEQRCHFEVGWASAWVTQHGSDVDRQSLHNAVSGLERARKARSASEMKRQLTLIRRLGSAAYLRSPGAWNDEFEHAASRVSEAHDVAKAQALVDRGRKAAHKGDLHSLEAITRELWSLLPADHQERVLSHGSGVR